MRPVYFLFVLGVSMLISCTKAVQPESPVSCNREDEYQCLLDELGVKNLSVSPEEFYLMSPEQKTELRKALGVKPLTKSGAEQLRWYYGDACSRLFEEVMYSDVFTEDSWSAMYLKYNHLLSTIGDEMTFWWKVKWGRTYFAITESLRFYRFFIENISISTSIFDKATITKSVEGEYDGDQVSFNSEINVYHINTRDNYLLYNTFLYCLILPELKEFPEYVLIDAYEYVF